MPPFESTRFGQYLLTAHLGHGGMADVFRARREGPQGFERTVVIKRILSKHHSDPRFVEMFINEAKLAARLQHPNIVQVHELGEQGGEFFMVLEYVDGKDLLRILRATAAANPRHPSLPQPVAAYIMREMCRGLQHAHDHRSPEGHSMPIVHRDVSPQNVMLSYDGQVKLVDFGIAKALDSMKESTRTGVLKGKFAYMAPEQLAGAKSAPASDIFSAGVLLHEMLTGRRLFKGETDYDTLSNVKSAIIKPPSATAPHVSPELDAIVLGALERDPQKRTARASRIARDLDVYLQSARFSVEDMHDFLSRLFPPDARVDPAEVSLTPRIEAPASSATPVVADKPISVSRSAATSKRPRASRASTLAWAAAGVSAALVLIGVGAWTYSERVRHPADKKVNVSALAVAKDVDEPKAIPSPAIAARVLLDTDPTGAQVFDGPRLLGTTPTSVELTGPGGTRALTIVSPGYRDLSYVARQEDGATLTLRLTASSSSSGAHGSTRDKRRTIGEDRVKVKVFDESEPARKPKVDAIDD